MFDLTGAKVGGEIRVNSAVTGDQRSSQVDALPGGGFIVTWTGPGSTGSGNDVHGQIFDAAGAKLGAEFIVNAVTSGEQTFHKVSVLPNGDIVLVWTDNSGIGGDAPGTAVKMQILTADTTGPSDIALSSASVSETAIENLPVATLTATGALNSGFTWQIVSDSTGGAFRIDGDKLVVADNGRLDFETASTATVRVRATDSDGHAYEETFEVAVTDEAIEQRSRRRRVRLGTNTGRGRRAVQHIQLAWQCAGRHLYSKRPNEGCAARSTMPAADRSGLRSTRLATSALRELAALRRAASSPPIALSLYQRQSERARAPRPAFRRERRERQDTRSSRAPGPMTEHRRPRQWRDGRRLAPGRGRIRGRFRRAGHGAAAGP